MTDTAPAPWYRKLHWQITLGILLGLGYGLAVRAVFPGDVERWASLSSVFVFLGDLFIRALKMIIIPLIVASVVTGIKSLGDASSLGRIGLRTIAYYIASTFLAVSLGLVVVHVV
ncbi:MAG: cation:dicarboxylase symporter family transporter, partial [Myxococcota bacterium]